MDVVVRHPYDWGRLWGSHCRSCRPGPPRAPSLRTLTECHYTHHTPSNTYHTKHQPKRPTDTESGCACMCACACDVGASDVCVVCCVYDVLCGSRRVVDLCRVEEAVRLAERPCIHTPSSCTTRLKTVERDNDARHCCMSYHLDSVGRWITQALHIITHHQTCKHEFTSTMQLA